MYPVVIGNGRCMTKDTVIGGYQIPEGVSDNQSIPFHDSLKKEVINLRLLFLQVQIVFQHYVISNQDRYFPDSDKFIPERWMTGSDVTSGVKHAFASLPFGYGRRMCLGRRFAELEMIIVLAKVYRNFWNILRTLDSRVNCDFFFCQVVQSFRLEYHHEKLDYHIHPMYTPKGPLKIKMIDR